MSNMQPNGGNGQDFWGLLGRTMLPFGLDKYLPVAGAAVNQWWKSPAKTVDWNAAGPTQDEIGSTMIGPSVPRAIKLSDLPSMPYANYNPNGPDFPTNYRNPGYDQTGTADVTYLDMLKSLLEQGAGGGGNFGAALASINKERANVNKTYKENRADIKTMFGNLTTSRQADIPKYGELQAAGREGVAAQTAANAAQTRDAEAARLEAANRARAELGLGDIAAASATGDIATKTSEAGLADQAALAEISRSNSLTNQAIGEQAIQDEIQRYGSDQSSALSDLGTTRDAYLRDISGREQNILAQQAAAQAQASQANAQFQLQIAGLINQYEQGQIDANKPEGAFAKWVSQYGANDQAAAAAAVGAHNAFYNWIQTAGNLTGPTSGKPMNAMEAINAFAKASPENAKMLQTTPSLNLLLQDLWNAGLGK